MLDAKDSAGNKEIKMLTLIDLLVWQKTKNKQIGRLGSILKRLYIVGKIWNRIRGVDYTKSLVILKVAR